MATATTYQQSYTTPQLPLTACLSSSPTANACDICILGHNKSTTTSEGHSPISQNICHTSEPVVTKTPAQLRPSSRAWPSTGSASRRCKHDKSVASSPRWSGLGRSLAQENCMLGVHSRNSGREHVDSRWLGSSTVDRNNMSNNTRCTASCELVPCWLC